MLKQQYENLRNQIRLTFTEGKYAEVISLCTGYLKELKSLEDTRDDENFCLYEISLAYKKLRQIDKCIEYSLKSLNCFDLEEISTKYVKRLWSIAGCYLTIGNIVEAKKLYHNCSKHFKNLGDKEMRIMILFNIAIINKNFRIAKILSKTYEANYNETTEQKRAIEGMIEDLVGLYITENKKDEALSFIYGIKDRSLKLDFLKKVA